MSQSTLKVARIYRLLISLYPSAFRNDFAGEMQEVFIQAVEDYSKEGTVKILVFCLRELLNSPGSIFQQHWAEFQKERAGMTGAYEINQNEQPTPIAIVHQPGSWGKAFLAGLLHLLMGLLIGAGKFLSTSPETQLIKYIPVILGLSLGLLVAIIMVYVISPKREHVNLGIPYRATLEDPEGLMQGKGKIHRHGKISQVG